MWSRCLSGSAVFSYHWQMGRWMESPSLQAQLSVQVLPSVTWEVQVVVQVMMVESLWCQPGALACICGYSTGVCRLPRVPSLLSYCRRAMHGFFCIKCSLTTIKSFLDIPCTSSLCWWWIVFRKWCELVSGCPGLYLNSSACMLYLNSDWKASAFQRQFSVMLLSLFQWYPLARLGGLGSCPHYLSVTWMILPIIILVFFNIGGIVERVEFHLW